MQINIPTDKKQDIVDAFCSVYKYKDTIESEKGDAIPNSQTKKEFTDKQILKYIQEVHSAYKVNLSDVARQTAITDSKTFTSDFTVT